MIYIPLLNWVGVVWRNIGKHCCVSEADRESIVGIMARHEIFDNLLRPLGRIGWGRAVELLWWLHHFLVEYCKHLENFTNTKQT